MAEENMEARSDLLGLPVACAVMRQLSGGGARHACRCAAWETSQAMHAWGFCSHQGA